ncbi:MAG: T9SS type A sorting domain-containing protein [Flavobacteriales bacterium]|nr:T9SS type A sorting domain-containing protein [Flavobacteriales bacterium]
MTKLYFCRKNCAQLLLFSTIFLFGKIGYSQILWINVPNSTYECHDGIPHPIATSPCEVSVTYEEIITPGDCPSSYTLTLISSALDLCGNSASRTDVINVTDFTAPFFATSLMDITINCDDEVPPIATVEVFDNCSESVLVSVTEEYIIDGCTKTIYRSYSATDDCGNVNTMVHVITQVDAEAPFITAEPIVYNVSAPGLYATVTDNCTEVLLTVEVQNTYLNDQGVTVQDVVYHAYDECGNHSTFFQQWFLCTSTTISFTHTAGGSLAGIGYIITNNAGVEVASGISTGGSSFIENNCLTNGCYHLQIINPDPMNPNIEWSLTGAYGGTIVGFISLEYDFSIGAPCGGTGCMEPTACNYNPYATTPGLCFGACIHADLGDVIPPVGEIWGFELSQINTNFYLEAQLPYSAPINLQPFTQYTINLFSNGNNGWNGNTLTFVADAWNWSQGITFGSGDPGQVVFTTGGPGCTDPNACNYNQMATVDDGSCLLPDGCTDIAACNFNPLANCDNGSCMYLNAAFTLDVEELEGWTALYLNREDGTTNPANGSCGKYKLTFPGGSFIEFDAASREDAFGTVYYPFYSIPGTYTISYTDCCLGSDNSIYSSTSEETFTVAPCNPSVTQNGWLSMSFFTVPGAYIDYQIYRQSDAMIVATGSHSFTDVQLFLTGECLAPGCYSLAVSMNFPMTFVAQWPLGNGFSSPEEGEYYYMIPFSFGVTEGCLDPIACNYNPDANCHNQDLCGSILGCTDNAAINYQPDADCNDGSCVYVENDERAGAILAVVNNKGSCTQTKIGNLALASVSQNAMSQAITGEDLWYQFIAPEPGIAIRITSSTNDILVELQNAQGQLLDSENLVSGLGNEYLNYGQLVVGQTYYVAVRNFNSQMGEGEFTLCLQKLMDTFCAASNDPNPTPCTVYKANIVSCYQYNFHFTSLSTNITYDIWNSNSLKAIYKATGIVPEQDYTVLIDAIYLMQNGTGANEFVTVNGVLPCQIYLNANALTGMDPIDNCSNGSRALNKSIKTAPVICGASDYEWRFENQDGIQPVIVQLRGSNVNSIKLNTVVGLQTNSFYNVQVRPVYSDGSRGDYGPVQCLQTAGNRSLIYESEATEELAQEGFTTVLYPNPSRGDHFFISFGEQSELDGDIEVYDNMGRLVMREKIMAQPESTVEITLPEQLSTGNYIVRMIGGDKVFVHRMIVE